MSKETKPELKHVPPSEQPKPHYFGMSESAYAKSIQDGFDVSEYIDLKYEDFPKLKPVEKLSEEEKREIAEFEKTHDMKHILRLVCRMSGVTYVEVETKDGAHDVALTESEATILGAVSGMKMTAEEIE
jgi:hypothetical protein